MNKTFKKSAVFIFILFVPANILFAQGNNTTLVGQFDTGGMAKGVADHYDGLRIIDISDPVNPSEIGFFDTAGSASGVYTRGSYAYVADAGFGLRILDVSDPANPFEAGYFDTADYTNDVVLDSNYVYLADDDGLYIIENDLLNAINAVPGQTTESFYLMNNFPNPFNPQTTIAFELPDEQSVVIHVFDVSGHLVRVLVDGEVMAPGHNSAIWNGRDDTGKRVASGTYFYRLEAGEYSETKCMALIK